MLIARYPERTAKKIDVDSDKPCFTVVIRLFEVEPGVLIRLHPEKMHKRRRRTLRIPREVYLRVRTKLARRSLR
jgi:hypothetical protein